MKLGNWECRGVQGLTNEQESYGEVLVERERDSSWGLKDEAGREGICGAEGGNGWSRTVCGAGRVMCGGGCGMTSTRGVWVCGTMVVGRRFRVCVVREGYWVLSIKCSV